MGTPFVKMHGLGNDYIYFDCIRQPKLIADPRAAAARLADRHFGIGGDGIVLILPHPQCDFEMRMYNADGSQAEMCGNAVRCVGKYVYDNGYTRKTTLTVATGAGQIGLELRISNGLVDQVRVDMGAPILNGRDIPTTIDRNPVVNEPIDVQGTRVFATCVSMGNPHCVLFVDDLDNAPVGQLGPLLEHHSLFPQRINVEFVRIRSRTDMDMRVWERGSGETMACGTGACAVAVAGVLNGLSEQQVTVHLRGGDLSIGWGDDNRVYMTGPATFVFKGEVEV